MNPYTVKIVSVTGLLFTIFLGAILIKFGELPKSEQSCDDLNPKFGKQYEVKNGFYQGLHGTAIDYNRVFVMLSFSHMRDRGFDCKDLKEVL